jgi:hypothetical protein
MQRKSEEESRELSRERDGAAKEQERIYEDGFENIARIVNA